MARIYKRSDRIPVRIDDIKFKLAPLSFDQKTEIQQLSLAGRKGDYSKGVLAIKLSMQHSIKAIEGLEDAEGKPYELKFENGSLTDECMDDIFNLEVTSKLILVCSSLANGVPHEFQNTDGKKLEGVEILKETQPVPNS